MGVAATLAVALVGVSGHVVHVEADLGNGLPGVSFTGLPDAAVHESRDRMRAAFTNSGVAWPMRRITLNMAPGWLPKSGPGFDLPLAAAVLEGTGATPPGVLAKTALYGELALDGRVRPVQGVLPAVLAATRAGVERVIVPVDNLAEAQLVPDAAAVGVTSLRHLVDVLRGDDLPITAAVARGPRASAAAPGDEVDLADVLGQGDARRALEVAAAGRHHLFLVGPPGTGKTMLARRLPTVLPDLDLDAALETTAVHSVAGVLPADAPLVERPPFRDPHHSASVAALVGGSGRLRPGEVSLAHHGVLFLDEAPEFPRPVLDALRQPLEQGTVQVTRATGSATYPADVLLVLAANPCACAPASGDDRDCRCSPVARRRYLARLSGPLLDRVDLHVSVSPPSRADLVGGATAEPSAAVRQRVLAARERAEWRLAPYGIRGNARVGTRLLRGPLAPDDGGRAALQAPFDAGTLTARGVDRVLRVAWTLADLAGRDRPGAAEVNEALALRTGAVA